jgi:hypothetical protein
LAIFGRRIVIPKPALATNQVAANCFSGKFGSTRDKIKSLFGLDIDEFKQIERNSIPNAFVQRAVLGQCAANELYAACCQRRNGIQLELGQAGPVTLDCR